MTETREAGFTPGPWAVAEPWSGFSEIRGADGQLVFGLAAGAEGEKRPDEVCDANARLIAAAPEMYEALKATERAHDIHAACEDCMEGARDPASCEHCVTSWNEAYELRCAVLAKATETSNGEL